MGIWNRIKNALHKGTITSVPLPKTSGNTVNANARPETMGLWNRIKSALHKGTITSVPLPKNDTAVTSRVGQVQNTDNSGKIVNANAQSWDPETHPNGRGDSYLVQDYDYDASTKQLNVTYRDGFNCTYDNISLDEAKEFNKAPSKGRWAHKHLFNKPYHH